MADWGLYSALQGKDNWAQRRQDKAMNLQIVQAQAADEEKKVQKSMAAEQEINKYFDEIASMDVLEADKSRIEELEKKARQNIIQGIAQNNGDLARYASSGGMTDLGEYKRSIIQSQEVKDAMNNKMAMGAYLADAAKGNRYFNKVEVDIPMIGEDGEPMLDENGNVKVNRKMVDFKDAARLHKEGKINRLTYNGSENIVKLNPAMFKQYYKDPKNPYSKDNIVTGSSVKFQAMEMGASDEQSTTIARNYIDMVKKGGESWKFKADSELDYQNDMATIEKKRQSSSGSGSGGTMILNQLIPQLTRLGDGKEMPVGNKDYDFWRNNLRLKYDEKTGLEKSPLALGGVDAQTGKEYDLSKALSVSLGNRYVSKKDKNGRPTRYLVANAIFNADLSDANTPIDEGFLGSNKTSKDAGNQWEYGNAEDFGIISEDYAGQDVYRGEVLIPIERQIQDPLIRDEINKMRNITNKQDATAASATEQDYYVNLYSEARRVADATGVSIEEAMIGLSQ